MLRSLANLGSIPRVDVCSSSRLAQSVGSHIIVDLTSAFERDAGLKLRLPVGSGVWRKKLVS